MGDDGGVAPLVRQATPSTGKMNGEPRPKDDRGHHDLRDPFPATNGSNRFGRLQEAWGHSSGSHSRGRANQRDGNVGGRFARSSAGRQFPAAWPGRRPRPCFRATARLLVLPVRPASLGLNHRRSKLRSGQVLWFASVFLSRVPSTPNPHLQRTPRKMAGSSPRRCGA